MDVMIGGGRVRGFRAAPDVVAHPKIPFAEPPIGLPRFTPPRLVACWSGVRDCTRFAGFPLDSPAVTVAASDRVSATYQPVLETSPLSGVPDDVPLPLCHTANEEPLSTEPVRALAARHPRAHPLRFAIPPARHDDDIAYAFGHREDTRLRDGWTRFATSGDPDGGSQCESWRVSQISSARALASGVK